MRGSGHPLPGVREPFSLLPPTPPPSTPPGGGGAAGGGAARSPCAPGRPAAPAAHVRLMFRLSLATNWSRGLSVSEELATCR